MPLTKSARKAQRKDITKTKINRKTKDRLKVAMDAAKKTPTMETVSAGYSAIDRAAKNHLMHPNKAARLKSQLSKKLSTSATTEPVKVVKPTKAKSAKVKIAKAKAAKAANSKASK